MQWDFKKIIENIRRRTASRKKSLINISRDWTIILVVFTLLNGVSIGANVYMLMAAGSADVYISTEEERVETIDRTALNKVLQTYEQKQKRLESLMAQPPRVADPAQ